MNVFDSEIISELHIADHIERVFCVCVCVCVCCTKTEESASLSMGYARQCPVS